MWSTDRRHAAKHRAQYDSGVTLSATAILAAPRQAAVTIDPCKPGAEQRSSRSIQKPDSRCVCGGNPVFVVNLVKRVT
ncbi:hypothetical protein WBG83_12690 [Paenibacillus sp. y28]